MQLIDRAVYLVRDKRRSDPDPEPARYMDDSRQPYWQFFGTDDDAAEPAVEVVARMLVAPWTDTRTELTEEITRGADDRPPGPGKGGYYIQLPDGRRGHEHKDDDLWSENFPGGEME